MVHAVHDQKCQSKSNNSGFLSRFGVIRALRERTTTSGPVERESDGARERGSEGKRGRGEREARERKSRGAERGRGGAVRATRWESG